jgi:hypothetical protein
MATRISEETAARIERAFPDLLDALAAGEVMAPHYAKAKVSADQVRVWRVAVPERLAAWDAARQQSADAYADMILDVANNHKDSNSARVRIQALQWLAARRDPKVYADSSKITHEVRTVDLTAIILAANARLAAAQTGRVIDAEVVRPGLESVL